MTTLLVVTLNLYKAVLPESIQTRERGRISVVAFVTAVHHYITL